MSDPDTIPAAPDLKQSVCSECGQPGDLRLYASRYHGSIILHPQCWKKLALEKASQGAMAYAEWLRRGGGQNREAPRR